MRSSKCINYDNLLRNDTLLFSFTKKPGRSTNHLHNNTNIVILIEVLTEVEVVICLKGGTFTTGHSLLFKTTQTHVSAHQFSVQQTNMYHKITADNLKLNIDYLFMRFIREHS